MIDYTPIQKGLKQEAKTEDVNNLLLVRSVNQCINDAKSRPIPKMLFSEFWHEEELCILLVSKIVKTMQFIACCFQLLKKNTFA